jgi:hypothetical protein
MKPLSHRRCEWITARHEVQILSEGMRFVKRRSVLARQFSEPLGLDMLDMGLVVAGKRKLDQGVEWASSWWAGRHV